MKNPLAIVTMVFNESRSLPRWLAHYTRQTGDHKSLYVVDHGSTDGSTDALPCNVITLPRDAGGDRLQKWRAGYISETCSELLKEYEAVLYVDCDELVVADPTRWSSLVTYAQDGGTCTATFGFDVLHRFEQEPPLDPDRPVLAQRDRLLFLGAMCKPTFIRTPTQFKPGFHTSDHPPAFGDLYRFHLRYADMTAGLARLEITRALDRPEMRNVRVDHQQISNDTYRDWVKSWVSYPLVDAPLGKENPDFQAFASANRLDDHSEAAPSKFDYSYRSKRLYRVPDIFRDAA